MAFMERDVYRGRYYEVSANHGETHIVPWDVCPRATTYADLEDYVDGNIDNPEDTVDVCVGWLARMSAPGYLDCTDWSAHSTEDEANDYLTQYYGDEEG